MDDSGYTNSAVALIDILGFSRAVRALKNDPDGQKRNQLDGAIRVIKNHEDQLKTEFHKKHLDPAGDLRVTMFSDTVVCTQSAANALALVFKAHLIGSGLLQAGYLCRGGISLGSSYHQERVFYGDAVLDAHQMEAHLANTPRIIVCDAIAEKFLQAHTSLPTGFSRDILSRDTDGWWYVDVFAGTTGYLLANKAKAWPSAELSRYWGATEKCIRLGLQANADDPAVRSKFIWAANRYNAHVPDGFPRFEGFEKPLGR